MKSKIRFWSLGLTIALCGAALGQDTWVRQSVLPTDRSAGAVYALSPDRAIFVGENELILETNTAGSNWSVKRLLQYGADPYYMINFGSAEVGLISGNNQLLRTVDGGANWQPIGFFGGSWYHIDWISPTTVIVGANGACAASVDGGESWELRSGWPTCPVMYGMDFRDENVGLVGGNIAGTSDTGIFKTINGGRNWTLKDQVAANDVLWTSQTRAIADEGTTIRESTDSGDTWHTIGFGITTGLVSMTRAGNSNVIIGVSAGGDVWRSPDLGFNWVQTFDGPGALPGIWETHFADTNHGWIVGPGAFLYYTVDGGITWQQKNSGTNTQVNDIQMLTPSFGMAVGHNGYVYRTTNGGSFWEVQKLEVTGQIWGRDESLEAIDIVDADFAVAAGPGGTVFKTHDGGVNWISIGYPVLPNGYYIFDVDFIDHNLGYLYGVDQDPPHTRTLYRTRDSGNTWEWVYLGERGGGTTVQFVDADYGWLTADNDFGLRTTDGGNTWQEFRMPGHPFGVEVSKVRFLNRSVGWAAGWWGYLAKTTNGGATWQAVNLNTTEDNLFDVVPVSESEIWLCGREHNGSAGIVYHSTNGGQSWTRQVVSPGNEFTYPYRFTALPTGDAWYGGYAGRIARRLMPATEVRPTAFNLVRGVLVSGSLQSVLESDNSRLQMKPGVVLVSSQAPVVTEFIGQAPTGNLSSLSLVVESAASSANIEVRFEMFDYDTGQFVQVGSSASSTTDQTYTFERADANRFTSSTGEVKSRISYKATGPTLVYPWNSRLDLVRWRARG